MLNLLFHYMILSGNTLFGFNNASIELCQRCKANSEGAHCIQPYSDHCPWLFLIIPELRDEVNRDSMASVGCISLWIISVNLVLMIQTIYASVSHGWKMLTNENVHCEEGTHDRAALLSSCIMDHVQVRITIDLVGVMLLESPRLR